MSFPGVVVSAFNLRSLEGEEPEKWEKKERAICSASTGISLLAVEWGRWWATLERVRPVREKLALSPSLASALSVVSDSSHLRPWEPLEFFQL